MTADARRADLPWWLGLRYPASDSPRPARELFKKIGARPLPDVHGALCEMVPLRNPDTGRALPTTHGAALHLTALQCTAMPCPALPCAALR